MTTALELTDVPATSRSNALRVALVGELDIAVAKSMEPLAAALVATGASVIEIDLAGVTFIDVAGCRALGWFRDRLQAEGLEVVVGSCSRAVLRLRSLLADVGSRDARPTARLTACGR